MQSKETHDAGKKEGAERSHDARDKQPENTSVAPGVTFAPGASLMDLQRLAGNQAVTSMVGPGLQRIMVDATNTETLYNTESASGQATATQFGGTHREYELTRQADTGATVKVRIRFMSQQRNTVPPNPPTTTARLGAMIDSPTEIPTGDPRREWATNMARSAVTNWNGHLIFCGQAGETRKRLPVTFEANAVFGSADPADTQVIVHPPSSIGGSPGHPIDAGNWYQQRDTSRYPAADNIIYAHEYGHLLGIPDEYSQSNQQMHLLMHQASPTGAANAMAALDRVTVERMTLAALRRPLRDRLDASSPGIANAFRRQEPLLIRSLAAAARAGIQNNAVTEQLQFALEQASQEHLHRRIPDIIAFQTTNNFSNLSFAREAVAANFSTDAISGRLWDVYQAALLAPHDTNVAVAGLGDVRVRMSSSVAGLGEGTGPASGAASGLATTLVGPAPGALAPGGLPQIAPPSSLVGQLSALPTTWAQAGSALESQINPEQFTNRVAATLLAQNVSAILGSVAAGVAARPQVAQHRALYAKARDLVTNAARTAAGQMVVELLATTVDPVLQASVTSLQAEIQTEVNRVMTTPPEGVAALGPADPNMASAVATMKSRLDAAKAATAAAASRDPVGAGQAAPDQDVTYSYQGLMGSNATAALRADQFNPMLAAFNLRLKQDGENDFTAEVT